MAKTLTSATRIITAIDVNVMNDIRQARLVKYWCEKLVIPRKHCPLVEPRLDDDLDTDTTQPFRFWVAE